MERMWPECVTFPAMELGILPLTVKFFLLSYISLAKDCEEKQCDFNQLDLKIFQPYLSTTTEGIFISSLHVQCREILFHVTMRCAWMYEWRKKGGTCEEASCTQLRCAFPCQYEKWVFQITSSTLCQRFNKKTHTAPSYHTSVQVSWLLLTYKNQFLYSCHIHDSSSCHPTARQYKILQSWRC